VWDIHAIADAIAAGLRDRAAALDLEQALLGIDALDELAMHPLIADSLQSAGFGVFREQRYPIDRVRTRESEGERCDVVLTPDGRPLRAPDRLPTLFDPPDAIPLDEAFWLEVKVVSQFTSEGPNRNYSSQLLSTVRQDIAKLAKEPGILHAGLLIVLFVASEEVADHDLGIWQDRCLQRSLPIGSPARCSFAITDRIGNATCCIALFPVRHL
jgi:hypothetical protein